MACTLSVPAFADDVAQPAPPPPPGGKMRIEVRDAMPLHGRAYVTQGRRVRLIGHVHPFVAGQVVRLRISSPHRKTAVVRAKVHGGGGDGVFSTSFPARRAVKYTITASHPPTPQQGFYFARAAIKAIDVRAAGPGSRGPAVSLLKQALSALGYPAGGGPSWTDKLGREVMAFRKTNRMARVFTANRAVFSMVFAGKGAFRLRHPEAGKHVEFDWSRQVLALADGAKPVAVYHASSGKPSTPTVFGSFHFYMKAPGTNAKGMYDSNYFVRGYAVHGYPDVPTYAASHGCIRVPNADAPTIFGWIAVGDPIFVYR
ncbi:MAG: L,D-transpeptidase [Thermoleophilaceae bacterium]